MILPILRKELKDHLRDRRSLFSGLLVPVLGPVTFLAMFTLIASWVREDRLLTIRAASPVFAEAVGNVSFSVDEGLTGWVARHRTPEFIRDQAMNDPRMTYVPLLQEERFQSMVAVPILARAGDTVDPMRNRLLEPLVRHLHQTPRATTDATAKGTPSFAESAT